MERIAVMTHSLQLDNKSVFVPVSLLFDKIYLHRATISAITRNTRRLRDLATKEENELWDNEIKEIEFLLDKGILQEYVPEFNDFDYETDEERQFEKWVDNCYENLRTKNRPKTDEHFRDWTKEDWKKMTEIDNEVFDIETRRNVIGLKKQGLQNVYPVLASNLSYPISNKKNEVLNFVLSQIPTAKENTPWEQIIDFRNDPDSKLKYYALTNWVNSVASSNRPLNEIQDEYEYLYHQYARHFELHKIKTNFTTWEMFVGGGLEVLAATQGLPTFFKNLFSISKTRIELLQDEMKLPGQEIAYIHKANRIFK